MMYMDTCRLRLLASFDFLGCHVGSEVFAYTLKAGLARLLHEIVGCVDRPREESRVYPVVHADLRSAWEVRSGRSRGLARTASNSYMRVSSV